MNRPSRKLESRSGASRKSRAERDGGVSTTMRSQRPVLRASSWSWPSFSIAMYSWVPANELEESLRTELADAGHPVVELPLLPGGIDRAALDEMASILIRA